MAEVPISPVQASRPELVISQASINNEPVELDGTPTSPEKLRDKRRSSKPGDASPEEREQREKLISQRQGDKAVLVAVPQTPSAQEFEKSEDPEANTSSITSG